MSMTIDVFASRKEAEDFIVARDLKKFGEPRIREVVLPDKTIYRVNINNSGYKAYQDFMFAKSRPTLHALDAAPAQPSECEGN